MLQLLFYTVNQRNILSYGGFSGSDKMKKLVALIIFLMVFGLARAQVSRPDTIYAHYTTEKITLDGRLDEPCWSQATRISNFTQRELTEGAPPTERTEVAIVYKTNKIYIGFWGYDSDPAKLIANRMNRDFRWSGDDNFEVIISTFNDNRNGYLFVTNPNGARADVLISEEGAGFNMSWNGVWDVRTTVTDEGWFAEFEIPFSTLKFPKRENQIWAINFERNVRRKREQLMWQGWYRIHDLEQISQAGKLAGMKGIKAKSKVEIKPYVSGGVEREDGNKLDGRFRYGGDINYDITPMLKLNLTVHTDFAQVEADRTRINLSRFSLYYPEKRQFFLEGKDNFQMNLGRRNEVFYSRRIGIHDGEEVPIIAGVRLFGKQKRTNIGLLSIQTAELDSVPTTNFSVIRISQDVLTQSNVGIIATSKILNGRQNFVYGADFNYATTKLFGDKNLVINGSIAQSQTSDGINKNNFGYHASLAYHNDIIEYDLAVVEVLDNFNPELGFLRRQNYRMYYTEFQYNPRPKWLPFFRNLVFKPIDINYYVNSETGEMESVFYEWRPLGFETKSGEFMEFNVQHVFDRLDEPFNIKDDIYIPEGEYWNNRLEIQAATFRGRKISMFSEVSWGGFYTGKRTELSTGVTFNISKHWNMYTNWTRNYVNLPEGSFVTDEMVSRIQYAYNPKLNTSIFGQWNTEGQDILLNFRINWIPKIGTDFYFVVNQSISTIDDKFTVERTTIIGKLIWRFAI